MGTESFIGSRRIFFVNRASVPGRNKKTTRNGIIGVSFMLIGK